MRPYTSAGENPSTPTHSGARMSSCTRLLTNAATNPSPSPGEMSFISCAPSGLRGEAADVMHRPAGGGMGGGLAELAVVRSGVGLGAVAARAEHDVRRAQLHADLRDGRAFHFHDVGSSFARMSAIFSSDTPNMSLAVTTPVSTVGR